MGRIRLIAEWEAQDGILLSWPTEASDWAPLLDKIEAVFVELVRQISRYEQVVIAAPCPKRVEQRLAQSQIDCSAVRLYEVANNDTWARDFGPITVEVDGQPRLYDFGFNGWGLKFAADEDNRINRRLQQLGAWDVPCQVQPLILEGGSIECDGRGTLLTTSACLLSDNRNPHLTRGDLELWFQQHLGIRQVLWLDHGFLAGDDTDSHIDTLARICPQDTILYVQCDDPSDEHYAALKAMAEQLHDFRTQEGTPFRLLPLPWPASRFDEDQQRLPATYANFLVINGAVLVPTYDDPADQQALKVIAQAYPQHDIIGVNCLPVIYQHGSLHCLTMQLPKGTLS
ncbi:MAG: agmatine deiminase family protein [Desulfuromonadaceae bacterium]|nr:agmatine deiminase family protein [Desulfuromonadaceae bacterium]